MWVRRCGDCVAFENIDDKRGFCCLPTRHRTDDALHLMAWPKTGTENWCTAFFPREGLIQRKCANCGAWKFTKIETIDGQPCAVGSCRREVPDPHEVRRTDSAYWCAQWMPRFDYGTL